MRIGYTFFSGVKAEISSPTSSSTEKKLRSRSGTAYQPVFASIRRACKTGSV